MTMRAGVVDTVRVLALVMLPTLAGGVIKRRPRMMALADRIQADRMSVAAMRTLRARHGSGPLLLRLPGRTITVILAPDDVGRVLAETPSPFTPAALEKRAALGHFQPHGVLATPAPERDSRRRYNEAVLEPGHELHSLAPRMRSVIREEVRCLVPGSGRLDWIAFERAWWRIVRRIVFGDHARDDDEVTDLLATLRLQANWAFLVPRATRRRARFQDLVDRHLDRAEPGSLAATIAATPGGRAVNPHGQVPHWLFAFDAAAMVTLRTLALLATHPRAMTRARAGTDDPRLPYLRACVLESIRLWPTTPFLLRETTESTCWRGGSVPPETAVLVFTPYFHRAPEIVPFADVFEPQVWLDGRAARYPALVPFSTGPAGCPGKDLVLFLSATVLADLLDAADYVLRSPVGLAGHHGPDARIPATLDNFGLRFGYEARGRPA